MEDEITTSYRHGHRNLTQSSSLSFLNQKTILIKKQSTVESEDSSYDSDCEVSDSTVSANHYDVSRTVSDTLGQEYDDYVTSTTTTTGNYDPNPAADDSVYQTRLEFARKLGYTEVQVKVALSKLGPSPSQNELLAELIQLDCSSSSSSASTNGTSPGGISSSPSSTSPGDRDENSLSCSSSSSPNSSALILRHIVIDGSNVAMSHGNNKTFSCRGIQLAVNYFKGRGHKDITVFVPSYRKEVHIQPDSNPVTDQEILLDLEKEGQLVFTPSRILPGNKRLVCYDDRYILKLAVDTDGIVVSNDNYRDLTIESPDFKRIVTERICMYSFVNDRFMPPEDPLGRNGPSLDQLLSKTPLKTAPPCPYGRKCTYGSKCKYFHPIIKQSVSEVLRKQAALKSTQSLPINSLMGTNNNNNCHNFNNRQQIPISRTRSAVPLGHGQGLLHGYGSITNTSPAPIQSSPAPTNTHKKLQRQLSINPVSDPRIRPNSNNYMASSTSSSNESNFCNNYSTYLSPFPTQPGLSDVWSPAASASASSTSSSPLPQQSSSGAPFDEPDRNRIYYHLVAIFPKTQVLHVMNLYPGENDPQVICKHIIQNFS